MPDDVKHRTPAPTALPTDEQFTPGREPAHEPHPPEDDFWQNLMYESNDYKIEHYRASAQQLANDNDCAVLLHYYALPGYQNCNGTMMAAFIPAEEGKVGPPAPPANEPPASSDPSWRRG